ncbi:MAG TPA: hypothetical protein VFG68_22960 [Fimbriiglobus sp.]|nr:hypothetical protein [Fimbriiglobus sp.]
MPSKSPDEVAEIRRVFRETGSVRATVRQTGADRNTVRKYVVGQLDEAPLRVPPAEVDAMRDAAQKHDPDPDLDDGWDEPTDRVWRREEGRSARAIRKAQQSATFRWTAPGKNLLLAFISDMHIGPGTPCDFRRMREDAELIRDTPGCYAVLAGDQVDNHCLDEQTQALTRRGWRFWWQLEADDAVYGVDIETGRGEWQPINKVVTADYSGDMVHIVTESIDLLCTPGHRVLCKGGDTAAGAARRPFVYETAESAESAVSRRWLPVAADMGLDDKDGLSDDEIRLAAWVLTDGWIEASRKTPLYRVAQRASNSAQIGELLDRLGYKWTKCVKTSEAVMAGVASGRLPIRSAEELHTFCVSARHTPRLGQILPSKAALPEWVFRLSLRQFGVFLETLVEGDGSVNGNAFILYGKQAFLEEVQAACVCHGWKAVLRHVTGRDERRLLICPVDKQQVLWPRRAARTTYTGVVWCLQVPLGNFLVRRNGKPVITGNCKHKSAILASRSQPEDQYKLFEYYLSILGDRCLVVTSGNHDDWTNQIAGVDVLGRIVRDRRVFYSPDEAWLELAVGSQTYVVGVRHQYRYGSSFNQTHTVKQWLRLGPREFDVGVIGHHHEAAIEQVIYRDRFRWVCRPGSYQITSSYARQYGFNHAIPTCPTFLFDGDERDVSAWKSVAAMARSFKVLREMRIAH